MTRSARAGIAAVLVALAAGAGWFVFSARHAAKQTVAPALAPLPRDVRIEVMNSTKSSGAARTAMLLLRHAGLDVVYFGSAIPALQGRAHNQILVRRGDTVGVGRVVEALSGAEIIEAPDSTRLVDLTVLIGADFLVSQKKPGHP